MPHRRRRHGRHLRRRPAGPGPRRDRGRGDDRRGARVREPRRPPALRPRRLRRGRHLPAHREGDRGGVPPGLLPRDPPVALQHGGQGPCGRRPDRDRAGGGREAVRARPCLGTQARGRPARPDRRVAALPDRPLPRQDAGRGHPLPALRQLDARAGLEPKPRRERADHDGRGLRRRGSGPLLRRGRRAARRRPEPSHAGARPDRDGAAGACGHGGDGRPQARRLLRDAGSRPGPHGARPVRRLPRRRRRRRGLGYRDVRGPPHRDRQLALVGRAVLHPRRQGAEDARDRGAGRVQAPAPARLPVGRPPSRAEPLRPPHRSQSRHDDPAAVDARRRAGRSRR